MRILPTGLYRMGHTCPTRVHTEPIHRAIPGRCKLAPGPSRVGEVSIGAAKNGFAVRESCGARRRGGARERTTRYASYEAAGGGSVPPQGLGEKCAQSARTVPRAPRASPKGVRGVRVAGVVALLKVWGRAVPGCPTTLRWSSEECGSVTAGATRSPVPPSADGNTGDEGTDRVYSEQTAVVPLALTFPGNSRLTAIDVERRALDRPAPQKKKLTLPLSCAAALAAP